jgi:prepilin-type N-terminal cleavage/methylation domain-containing protein
MLTSIKQRMDREDEGFTLIELMVVLLIIAILLAIAIPTFLGARNTANARSTQENLRNALTAEQSNWTSNQIFATGLGTLEPSLTWGTTSPLTAKGTKDVSVAVFDGTASTTAGTMTSWATESATTPIGDGVVLMGYGKDNNCYYIFKSNNATADFTAYDAFTAPSTGCALPAASNLPLTAPSGSAAGTVSANTISTWFASF